jgi:hypothetical protein
MRNLPIPALPSKPPRQLSMALDSVSLRGMSPSERRTALARLAVNFQEVVHSVLGGKADVARHSDSRRTEWTSTKMPA